MSVYTENQYNNDAKNEAWFKLYNFIPENTNVLDIGCSSGNFGATLKKDKNCTVTGIDIDEADVKLAEKKLDNVRVVDLEQDDFSDLGMFDVVIMADVIEHLVDPVKVLKKIKKNLKKDGVFVFSVPNMANATIRLKLMGGRFEYKDWGLLDKTHIHFYDTAELARVFSEAGYSVIKTDNTIREIPEEILKNELEKIGLSLTEKFKTILDSDGSITYQFIGSAKVGTNKKNILNVMPHYSTSSLDSVSEEIDKIITYKDSEINRHINIINDKDKELAVVKRELKELKKHVDEIKSSKAWLAVTKIRKIKSKVTYKK